MTTKARKTTTSRPARKLAPARLSTVPDDKTGAAAPTPADDTTGDSDESAGLTVGTFVRWNDDDGAPQVGRILHASENGVLIIEPVGTVARHRNDVLAVEVTA